MKPETKHNVLETVVNACRFLVGAVFSFSGFVKVVDPWGTAYKIQDYLTAFGVTDWVPSLFPMSASVLLSCAELITGMFLLIGIRRRIASMVALALLLFMTPLTLYLAIKNPVSDCGCFGDALILTNWQTFWKNVVLLVAAVVVALHPRLIFRFVTYKLEWVISLYTFVFVILLVGYTLWHLPPVDFRPYKIGTNIAEAMRIPDDAKPGVYKDTYVYRKGDVTKEFTLESLPDSTWDFVEARSELVEKGYMPSIHDFYLLSMETGEDLTDSILADSSYTFLLVMPLIEKASDTNLDLINQLYDYCFDNGYAFYGVTYSSEQGVEQWRYRTGAEYPFCNADEITLKTIIRPNPGLVLLKQGTILNKWAHNDIPTTNELTDKLENLPIGKLSEVSNARNLKRIGYGYLVPLLVVILIDVWVIRTRERRKSILTSKKGNENEKENCSRQLENES